MKKQELIKIVQENPDEIDRELLKIKIKESLKFILISYKKDSQDKDRLFQRYNRQITYGKEEGILSEKSLEHFKKRYFRIVDASGKVKNYKKGVNKK